MLVRACLSSCVAFISRIHSCCIHSLFMRHTHLLFASIVHGSDRPHSCILSLFSCISHSAWSFPDYSFFLPLACIKTSIQLHVQKITIYVSHSFIVRLSVLRPCLVSISLSIYHIHGLMLSSLFPLFFMYQVKYSAPH